MSEPKPETTQTVHLSYANKRPDLPDAGLAKCPACGGDLQDGYGMAGGGFGVYQYCDPCGKIVSKTILED